MTVCDTGQVEREGRTLAAREKVPGTVKRCAKPFPVPCAQRCVLHKEQNVKVLAGLRKGTCEGIAHVIAKEGLAQDAAVIQGTPCASSSSPASSS